MCCVFCPKIEGVRVSIPALRAWTSRCPCASGAAQAYHTVPICDISQGGIKIESADPFEVNDDVVVSIEGFAHMAGKVRWKRDGFAGIAFTPALPFKALAQWATHHDRKGHAID